MNSSKLPRKAIAEAILRLAGQGADTKELARQIAGYLLAEGRMSEIDLLARDLEKLSFQQTGTLEITAESAHELNDHIRRAIEELFQAKQTTLHEELTPSLIGGVRVQAQDQVLDLSVRTRLRQLRNSA